MIPQQNEIGSYTNIPWNLLEQYPECSLTFPRIFANISWNLLEHSLKSSLTFPGIFFKILWNLLKHFLDIIENSPESFS